MRTRKCRWLPVALLALWAALPTHSWALGLGELEVESALNERFAGNIELLDVAGFQSNEIVVSLASREDFERIGVERFFYLTNLNFTVDFSGSVPNVQVSSSQPVSEPYLNFIVEVLWPRGRLLKEFTVLLDPPTFSATAAPAVQAPQQPVAQQPAPRVDSRPAPVAESGTRVNLTPRPAPQRAPIDGLMTTRDDTLWQIAQRTLPSERVTVNQQMLALQRKNPQAFIRNNINLLKAGYVLDMPTESEALAVEATQATASVAAQTRDWRSGASSPQVAETSSGAPADTAPELASQVDATARDTVVDSAASAAQGEVRIVANTGDLAAGTASGDDASVNQLIEEKDALARQVDELTYQLDREKEIAVNEVTVKDRQLEVKDAEIAQLQEQMAQMRAALAEAQANQNQNQSTTTSAPETPWWMSPMVLFGVIGVLVLVLVVALLMLRRSRVGEEAYEAEYETDEPMQPTVRESHVGAAETAVEDSLETHESAAATALIDTDDDDDLFDEFADDDLEVHAEDEVPLTAQTSEQGQGETGDVIGEAEIYIAYGRYGQAANLLSGALDKDPERWDVRLKMLEVCVESHDEESFATHAQYILDNCDDEEVLLACRDLEAQFDSSHVDLSAAADDAEPEAGSAVLADANGDDAEDTLELDLSELDAEEADASDDELDFELEFDTESESDDVAADADEKAGASAALGGDLGLDFDPDRDVDDARAEADDIEAPDDSEYLDSEMTQQEVSLDADNDDLNDLLDELDDKAPANVDAPQTASLQDDHSSEDIAATAGLDDSESQAASESEQAETVAASKNAEDAVDEFDFEATEDGDINATKLDLAEAYVDMGDADGAQDILSEVLEEGTPEQQQKAQEMLDRLAS